MAVKKDTGTEHLERRLLRDGESKGEALTAKTKKKQKNVGIECVDVGPEEEDAAEAHQGAREASVTSAERQDSDEKRQC